MQSSSWCTTSGQHYAALRCGMDFEVVVSGALYVITVGHKYSFSFGINDFILALVYIWSGRACKGQIGIIVCVAALIRV